VAKLALTNEEHDWLFVLRVLYKILETIRIVYLEFIIRIPNGLALPSPDRHKSNPQVLLMQEIGND